MAKKEILKIKETIIVELNFYAVRSQDGKWFRSKGYNGGHSNGSSSWVTDMSKAKLYGNPGPAKAQITFWSTNYPQFGVPDLVQITTATCNFIDYTENVKISQEKKKLTEAKREVRNLEYRINNYVQKTSMDKEQISKWQKTLAIAKKSLGDLKK